MNKNIKNPLINPEPFTYNKERPDKWRPFNTNPNRGNTKKKHKKQANK